jgi:hypothetical protein
MVNGMSWLAVPLDAMADFRCSGAHCSHRHMVPGLRFFGSSGKYVPGFVKSQKL